MKQIPNWHNVKYPTILGPLSLYVGDDVRVSKVVEIKNPKNIYIGNHVAIDFGFYCSTKLSIGSYCHISTHVSIIGGKNASVWMGDFSHLAAGARLIAYGDENMGAGLVSPVVPDIYRDKLYGGNIYIQSFASILTNAVISPNVTIGEGAIVAANSFVNKDIPDWEVWGGSPARFLKIRSREKMLEYAQKLGY